MKEKRTVGITPSSNPEKVVGGGCAVKMKAARKGRLTVSRGESGKGLVIKSTQKHKRRGNLALSRRAPATCWIQSYEEFGNLLSGTSAT